MSSNTDYSSVNFVLNNIWDFSVSEVTKDVAGTIGGIVPVTIRTNLKGVSLASLGYIGMVTINPLNNTTPYRTLESVITLNVRVAAKNGLLIRDWRVLKGSFNAVHLRHGGKANVCMADGHSEALSKQQYLDREPNYGPFAYGGQVAPFYTTKDVLIYDVQM